MSSTMDLPIPHLRTTMMGNSTQKSKNQMKIALSSTQMKYVAWLETEREACCQASKPVQKVSFSATTNHPNKRGQQQFDTSKQTYCYTMVTLDERIDRTKKTVEIQNKMQISLPKHYHKLKLRRHVLERGPITMPGGANWQAELK